MVRTAYVVLALIAIVPVWSVHYLPTGDGPCHLYNAWILHDLATGRATPPIATWYRIDWRPHPNWITHAVLALLLGIVPPLAAEKIFVTAILVTFFAGAWILSGDAAFIAIPFAYNMLFQSGFYNFELSVGLYMIVVGFWWKHRHDPSARVIATVAALLVLCDFAHPMATALAIGSIGLLWIIELRGRHIVHLIALVPAAALLAWFLVAERGPSEPNAWPIRERLAFLAQTKILMSFDTWPAKVGIAIAIVLLVLIAGSAMRRATNPFFAILVIFLGIYFFAPFGMAGGELVTQRMALFATLIVLPCLSPDLPRSVRRSVMIAFAVLALVATGYLVSRFRSRDRGIAAHLSTMAAIPPNSVVLPLLEDRFPPGMPVSTITHAIDYLAIDKHLVDLDNYEAGTGYFPIAWSPRVAEPDSGEIENDPEGTDFGDYAATTDVVFTWHMPPIDNTQPYFRLLSEKGPGRVYARPAAPR